MTAYVANHQKKLRIFAKRETELINAIRDGRSQEELLIAAEVVREAKMSVFKCKYAQHTLNEPHTFAAEQLAAENKKVALWLAITADEIIDRYREKPVAQRE